jgi:hypothetical protein
MLTPLHRPPFRPLLYRTVRQALPQNPSCRWLIEHCYTPSPPASAGSVPTAHASAAVRTPAASVATTMAHMAAPQRTPLLLCPQRGSQKSAPPGMSRSAHQVLALPVGRLGTPSHTSAIARAYREASTCLQPHYAKHVCAHPTCAPELAHAHSPEASPALDSMQPCPFLGTAQASARRHWPCAACSCMSGVGRTAACTPYLLSNTTPAAAGPSYFHVCRRPQRTSWERPAYGTLSRGKYIRWRTHTALVHQVQY